MQERRASEFSLGELAEFWNQGYAGYFVPLRFSEAQMETHLRCGGMDLRESLVWMDGDACVGFSYLGVRGNRGWIGGFGVTPAHRGRGFSYRLFARHVEVIRGLGLPRVQLEVLEENWARRVYERAGFAVTRRVVVLQGTLEGGGGEARVYDAEPGPLLAHHERLHAGAAPAWNRDRPWLEEAIVPGDLALVVGPEDHPAAVAWVREGGAEVRLLGAAAAEDEPARALARGLVARWAGRAATLVNEPEESPLRRALEEVGMRVARTQLEMLWEPG
jgi:GNAT superfamily N-acetyltransferase